MLVIEIIAIIVASIMTMRAILAGRRLREQQMMIDASIHLESHEAPLRRSSEDFHDQVWLPMCELIETHAVRLNCPLTSDQRRRIWRSRSPAILEELLKQIEHTQSSETLTQALANIPPGMDRPDPTRWSKNTL